MTDLKKAKVEHIKKNAFRRLAAPSPKFFKKIIRMAAAISGIGLGILGLPATGVVIPDQLLTIATYMVTIGAVAGVVAKFTVDSEKVQ